MTQEENGPESELEVYSVRLPKELVGKLPKAKIIARKPIQVMIREAIEKHIKGLNL